MASFNKITIVGYLGRDPETKSTPNGMQVTTFSVATSERRKDSNGAQTDHTTWFRVTAFGKTAEFAAQYLHKGSQVYLEGRLRLEEYTDKAGEARTSLEVVVNDVQALGAREQNGGQQHAAPTNAPRETRKAAPERATASKPIESEEDEIPF